MVISEKCSLKCKDCSNLMQYYLEPRNFSFDQVKNEFEELTKNIKHIFEIRLIFVIYNFFLVPEIKISF